MNKKTNDENSGRYFFNRLIIIIVFVAFAGTAFYLAFQQPSSSDLELGDTSNTSLDEHIWKKYRDKEKSHNTTSSTAPKKMDDDKCYTARYLSQVESINQIKMAFIEGNKFFTPLDKIRTNAKNDTSLLIIVDQLENSLENHDICTIQTLQNKFLTMRKDISKTMYINRAQNSFLLRAIARIIIIEKIGQSAINNGGISAAMERANQYLKLGAVKEAYDAIDNNLAPEYHHIAQSWLDAAKTHIVTNAAINDLGQYIHSKNYMMKFYKECR